MYKTLVTQVIALSWFRCLMEEGYDFYNKRTKEIEKNEVIIYQHFVKGTGIFDMPMANCSPLGLEKNTLEVLGNILLYNTNPEITKILVSSTFLNEVKEHIKKIRQRDFSGKIPN